MPCYCREIQMYRNDIVKLKRAYDLNMRMNDTNDFLEDEVRLIRCRECAAYEANNLDEIETAVDVLDDELRPKRNQLGSAIISKMNEAQCKMLDYYARDKRHHEKEEWLKSHSVVRQIR
ncbi:hypothetical protein AALA79_00005 [Lachnospiraceae bacterium 64-25]